MSVKSNAVAKLTYVSIEWSAEDDVQSMDTIFHSFQLQMLGYDISWAAFNIIEVMSSSKFTFKVWLN